VRLEKKYLVNYLLIVELTIRSSADLRNKYNEISKQCRETRGAQALCLSKKHIQCIYNVLTTFVLITYNIVERSD